MYKAGENRPFDFTFGGINKPFGAIYWKKGKAVQISNSYNSRATSIATNGSSIYLIGYEGTFENNLYHKFSLWQRINNLFASTLFFGIYPVANRRCAGNLFEVAAKCR